MLFSSNKCEEIIKKCKMASYDCCRICHRRMFVCSTRKSIANVVKKNKFWIEIAFVDDRLARLCDRGSRAHAHIHTKLNDLHSVITVMLWQVSYRFRYGGGGIAQCIIRSVRAKVRSSVITRICTTWIPIFCSPLISTKQLRGCNIETQSLDTYFVFTAIHFPWVPPTSNSILHSSLSLLHDSYVLRTLSCAAFAVYKRN